MSRQSGSNQGGNLPLDNLTFDVITVLHEKSKGMEAYQKYLQDAQGNQELRGIFEQMMEQDRQIIQQLQQHLPKLLGQQSGSATTGGGGTGSNS